MVLRLEIVFGLRVAVEVGDGAYIAGLGLHEDGAAPLSVALDGLGHEGVLDDILKVGVNRGDDVESVLGFDLGDGLVTSADTLDRAHAVDAPEFFVEALLEAGVTATSVAVDTADSAAGEDAEGFDTAVLVFEEDAGFIFAFLEQRVALEFAALEVVDTMVADTEAFVGTEVRPRDARFVLRLRVLGYDDRQIAREGVDISGEEMAVVVVERRYARVHVHVVLGHAGSEELAVAVEDVTARGLDGFARRHLFLRHFEPLVALYGLDVDDLAHDGEEAA